MHSDFMLLKTLVIKEHLELMQKKAYNRYFTAYRQPRLALEKISSGECIFLPTHNQMCFLTTGRVSKDPKHTFSNFC